MSSTNIKLYLYRTYGHRRIETGSEGRNMDTKAEKHKIIASSIKPIFIDLHIFYHFLPLKFSTSSTIIIMDQIKP